MAEIPGPVPTRSTRVFVYGTLKRGGEYHHLMQKCSGRFLGTGQLVIRYPLILADYPCLLDLPGKGYRVTGEIYTLEDESSWEILDRLEGHPEEYRRRIERVEMEASTVPAWTYFYIREDVRFRSHLPVKEFQIS